MCSCRNYFWVPTMALHHFTRAGEVPGGNATTLWDSPDEKAELAELRRRNRVLEQELEVMRRAAAYFGQAQLPSK